MLNNLPHGLGGATELIGAGRLMDATAAIQRMLCGLATAPGAADVKARHARTPPTIDGFAEHVETPTARRRASARGTFWAR